MEYFLIFVAWYGSGLAWCALYLELCVRRNGLDIDLSDVNFACVMAVLGPVYMIGSASFIVGVLLIKGMRRLEIKSDTVVFKAKRK